MMIKVRPDGLKNVTKNIDKDREELEYEINYWISKIEELQGIWQGEDADIFYNSCLSYVKRMSSITDFYDTMREFVGYSRYKYTENDESLKDNLTSSRVIVDEKKMKYREQLEKKIWEQK